MLLYVKNRILASNDAQIYGIPLPFRCIFDKRDFIVIIMHSKSHYAWTHGE